jgi:DNA polymerase II large subunit
MRDINEAVNRINQIIKFPDHYQKYNKLIIKQLYTLYSLASEARSKGFDPSPNIETDIAFDLSDRVERMFNIPLADRLRELLSKYRTENAALQLAEEVALGKFGYFENEESLNLGVRIGLAVVTDGITVAPLQGVSSVSIKKNEDGSNYIAISFAGPIRSAGGTEAAFTLIIADHLRKVLGLDSYQVNGWGEDETGRFVEELRIYEREVGNFQFRVSDEDIQYTLSHIPVEVDGVETDPVEVVVHCGLKRIDTDRVRGGALRVVNDGIIGRSRKLRNLVESLSLTGWEWLENLEGGLQQSSEETKTESSHFQEVISGRPVLSMPNRIGGFRLRYGRAYTTGLSAIGIHPIVPIMLEYPFVVGTQVKLSLPGKAGVVTFVDSIEPPLVRLVDGSFVKAESSEYANKIVKKIDKVVHLGDILICYGDFLENNTRLSPSGYVEEWWSLDLSEKIKERYGSFERCSDNLGIDVKSLIRFSEEPLTSCPTLEDALILSNKLEIPLHPHYLYYWNNVSGSEIILLRQKLDVKSANIHNCLLTTPIDKTIKDILEIIGIPHYLQANSYILQGDDAYSVMITLGLLSKDKPIPKWKNIEELLSNISGIAIRNKTSAYVGLRIGRPEKAMIRKMKPPVHVLFPVGTSGGPRRDIIHASKNNSIKVELVNMVCSNCGAPSTRRVCMKCGGEAHIQRICPSCKRVITSEICTSCKLNGVSYSSISYPIKEALKDAVKSVSYLPTSPFKGVKGLTNSTRIPELLEKGLLRRRYNLFIYKDGTIRFDATNAPLTHFRPKQISASLEDLRKLGYTQDIYGNSLKSEDQILELFVQDVILPYGAGDTLLLVSKFLDDLLTHLYASKPYYNLETRDDLLGHLLVGLAPHTSAGILGRLIGFTNAQVCYAHPYWHSAKRRDCDGDEDAVILLLDVLLNFSREYLPVQIGGLMDTPLLIQPIIIPKEVQRQAHNMDVITKYPKEFYEATLREASPNELTDIIDIVRSRLGKEHQFYNFFFTHDTDTLSIERERSTYSTLKTLQEKLNKQIELAKKIGAVNPNEVVSSVLNTHLLPDIIGNMKAYTSQSFRCKSCGESHRRFPLKGVCLSCGGELQSTVTRGSVEKYLHIALQLSEKFEVGEYLRNRFRLITEEFNSLFPKKDEDQLELTQFLDADN